MSHDLEHHVHESARRARAAALDLRAVPRAGKDAALHAMADALVSHAAEIVEANARDITIAREAGVGDNIIDRLLLDTDRIAAMAEGIRDVAALADPVGEVVRGSTLANGLQLRQVRVPIGVIGMIYEGRPNVTADAAAICLKAGNAVLLRGSRSAEHSNAAIASVLRDAVASAGLPVDTVQAIDPSDRSSSTALLKARGLVDLVIPRGGAGLIEAVVRDAQVPVIETGTGNVHVYVDADADLDMALAIVVNAKTHRTSVCNAAESLLVHKAVADDFLPRVVAALHERDVTIHGDATFAAADADVVAVTDEDYATEYLSLDIAARVVDSFEDAVAHIRTFSSGHTEAIVTRSLATAQRFTAAVDAAAIMVNASTRFTDGGELGMGAEIGISTQKLHARGPMGLPEMTTTTFVVTGDGHVR
ncbi:glutamate-5-semialdehyde dehydrogenase [Mumia sp. zg.B17]|uniref:glutamate-5-semialdehyde dehydrogenase n=1 Tax=Mumia sp. zg.B17 TaxID=2855446 RepID=UPI001C6F303E|nr:glutamate-5-semialdehyde dehydrogenase [Mumia sp. zg.B17]MBW9206518.1 glutamate-5-semialdehyde dehydrogenase [Mumia sp. zg.B17]